MLSVILMILRIIGLVLLAVLLLLLLLVASLVFVPLRYRAIAVVNSEQIRAELHASWFLHLVSLRMSYDLNGRESAYRLRIFGIDPERVSSFLKRHRGSTHASAKGREEEASSEDFENKKNIFYKFRKSCDTIRQIPKRFRKRVRRVRRFLEQPGKIIEWLDDYDAAEVFRDVRFELSYLLHHFRVRRGIGLLHFGTGDPASTGVLAGAMYLLFPASLGEVTLQPEYTEAVLDTDLDIRGHIRVFHLLGSGWRLFRNQKLRRLVDAYQNRTSG